MTFVSRRALLICNGGKVGRGTIVVTYQPRLETKLLSDGPSAWVDLIDSRYTFPIRVRLQSIHLIVAYLPKAPPNAKRGTKNRHAALNSAILLSISGTCLNCNSNSSLSSSSFNLLSASSFVKI
jgi:hypothetical protein